MIHSSDSLRTPDLSVTTFESWVGARTAEHLSTNFRSQPIAFQSWRNFKEAFAPELVQSAICETAEALGRPVRNCLDPFGGSGTTALTCQFLGVRPTTIEVNPFLADLIAAKLAKYDFELLADTLQRVVSQRQRTRFPQLLFPGAPATFVEPGIDGRYLFSREVAERMYTLYARIRLAENRAVKRLLRVMLTSIAVELSNAVVSGKGRRYRRNWTASAISSSTVDAMFVQRTLQAIYDLRRFANRMETKQTIIRGDSREKLKTAGKFDLAVFSPPYPNSFDYTDVYNIELWTGGYLKSAQDNRALRMKTLRSHVQIAREFKRGNVSSSSLNATLRSLQSVRAKLWNRHIPDMVGAYFEDMSAILSLLHTRLVSRGRVYVVVGDSRYGGVDVPVSRIMKEMMRSIGYKVDRSEPFRSMRSSPQQGGTADLPETLLVATR